MSETAPEQQTPEPSEAQSSNETPPWGDDFDPARAWEKIQKANREAASLRQRVMTPEQQQQLDEYNRLVEASKSEAQRQQEAVEQARRDAESARAEAVRYKAAATHGLSAEHFDLLGSGSEEEITARAAKIASLLAATQAAPPSTPPQTRPVEQLRPGATPGEAESPDEVLYKQLFG